MSVKFFLVWSGTATAHVAEQGFVLLLPTAVYIRAGAAAVALTVLALFLLPPRVIRVFFAARRFRAPDFPTAKMITSLGSFGVAVFVFHVGLTGPRDPLSNVMSLWVWTLGWIGLVSLSGIFGNLWHWLNPWTGLYRLIAPADPPLRLPAGLGQWPALVSLICFAVFLLVDIAPDDPARLAVLGGVYWIAVMGGLILFGPDWLARAELGHAITSAYARLATLRLGRDGGLGGPGWQLVECPPSRAAGLFALTLLAIGSFDGLNETFWWLAAIGVNPLEFPGRSAVVLENLSGLAAAVLALIAVFALAVRLGLRMADHEGFGRAFNWMAVGVLPIALAYHIAHYLTSFLVTIQYTLAGTSDPFATGTDWLGIQPFYVTTGFFNRIDSVRVIWSTQAGVVVLGHVWSVLLSHRIALSIQPDPRKAARLTLPLSILMIGYTFLGLWLLAAPRGA
ncbi:MAG: hypothetical protein AAF982_00815 [Pseudomonadota bacterium]